MLHFHTLIPTIRKTTIKIDKKNYLELAWSKEFDLSDKSSFVANIIIYFEHSHKKKNSPEVLAAKLRFFLFLKIC